MRIFTRIILICLLGLFFSNLGNAQSGSFNRKWTFSSIDGIATDYQVYTSLVTTVPDLSSKAAPLLFEGDPTKAQVQAAFFNYSQQNIGKFFRTRVSNDKISFQLDYGYTTDGDNRIFFDRIVASTGDIGNESEFKELSREEHTYDCNIVDQNCYVYQRYYYSFDRSKVYWNPDNLYAKLLIFRYYKYNKVVKTLILPILIEGSFDEYLGDSPGPLELITILRKPPGDESYTQLNVEHETSREVSMSYSKTNSKTETESITASVGFKLGPISGGGEVNSERSETFSKTNSSDNSYAVAFTANEEFITKSASDLFVIKQYWYQYGMQFTVGSINWGDEYVKVQSSNRMLMYPMDKIEEEWHKTEEQLLNDVIPDLEKNNKMPRVKFFQDVIALNKHIKEDLAVTKIPRVNGQKKITFTSKQSKAETITQEVSLETSKSVKVTASGGVEIGPISAGVEASSEKKWTVSTTTSNGNTSATENSKTIEYAIADSQMGNGGGDNLVTEILADPVFGTPIFRLNESESATSCPYEGGFQRDEPEITVTDPNTQKQSKTAKFSNIESGKEVVFNLTLTNNNKQEARSYKLKIPNKGNTPKVTTAYDLSEPFEMDPGEKRTIKLTVAELDVPQKIEDVRGFPDFRVIFGPDCDSSVADTVFLSAFYGDTDMNRAPENNMVCGAVFLPVNDTLQTTYVNELGTLNTISNKNSYSVPEEAILTPETNCSTGWCSETTSGQAEITNSVWFKFFVINPEITISTCEPMNAAFDSQMAVYKGTDCNDLNSFQLLAANDNGCSETGLGKSSWIYLNNLTVGDTLYLMVDGYKGAQSDFGIRLSSPRPKNDNVKAYISTILKVDGTSQSFTNYSATAEDGEQQLIPESTDPVYGWKEDQIQHSVWFAFIAPVGGEVIIDVENATFDSQVALFRNYRSSTFSTFDKIATNDDISFLGGLDSQIKINSLVKGQLYLILVDGYKGATGTFDLKLSIPTPVNDEACNAIILNSDALAQGPFSNGGASSSTAEQALAPPYSQYGRDGWSDEPGDPYGRQVENSVWFTFVASESGIVEISTWNQDNFGVQLAVYEVGECSDLATYKLIAAEDNSHTRQTKPDNQYPNGHGVRGSILNLTDLNPGATYYIMVDGYRNVFGQFSLDIIAPSDPPVNDEVCDAISLPTNGIVQEGFTNRGATFQDIENSMVHNTHWNDNRMNSSVWFKFVAPASGEAEISTCDMASFDTQLAVYSGNSCNDLTTFQLIAANDDGPAYCATGGDSFLPVKGLTPGVTYYLVVDGYADLTGSFDILIRNELTKAPLYDDVSEAVLLPVDGMVHGGYTNVQATTTPAEQSIRPLMDEQNPDCITGWCDKQIDNSVWFKFVAPSGGKVYISTCDLATFNTQLALYSVTNVNDFGTFNLLAANDRGPYDCSTNNDSYLPAEGLTAGKTYYVMVDGSNGDFGNFDISISTNSDRHAPEVPRWLIASETTSTGSNLSWTASTDDVEVTEYRIYVDGVLAGTSAETTFNLGGLNSSTTYSLTVVALDAVGNLSGSSIPLKIGTLNVGATFVAELNIADQFKVYPNPFKDYVNLVFSETSPKPISITLRDIKGSLVRVVQNIDGMNGNIQLDLAHLQKGLFFLMVQTESGFVTKKLIKY